jgi:hypothetical protein
MGITVIPLGFSSSNKETPHTQRRKYLAVNIINTTSLPQKPTIVCGKERIILYSVI